MDWARTGKQGIYAKFLMENLFEDCHFEEEQGDVR
jgi:hypothetical protein